MLATFPNFHLLAFPYIYNRFSITKRSIKKIVYPFDFFDRIPTILKCVENSLADEYLNVARCQNKRNKE